MAAGTRRRRRALVSGEKSWARKSATTKGSRMGFRVCSRTRAIFDSRMVGALGKRSVRP
jgi:hypothetical protein